MIVVVLACVTAVTAAVTGAVAPMPDLRFLPGGHWVYNGVVQAVFHIDGATANVDAQAPLPGDRDSQVVQGDTSGYVVGRNRITEFGKSTLNVEKTITPPADELPVGIEAAGGPYLAYRNAGIIVRLGEPSATVSVGDPLGDPVVTGDGTLWLFRTTTGLLCKLPKGADRISSCPAKAPDRHTGALTLVADKPQFVDTSSATLHQVNDNGLGEARPLGVRTSATARPATTDVSGRVAILDPANRTMHLVDTASPARQPVTVTLPDGDYDGPASTGSAVVLVDRKSDTVRTYDVGGKQRDAKTLPKDDGHPRLSRGEDSRVYVDGSEGTHVAVVDKHGKVADVPVTGNPAGPNQTPAPEPEQTDPRANPPEQNREPPREPASPPPKPPSTKPKPPPPPPTVPATVPGAPGSVSATAADGSAIIGWGPAADNRSRITGYLVSWAGGSLTAGPGDRSIGVPNLTNGVRYTFSVAAINRVGTGPAVAANPVTPAAIVTAPGAPQNLTIDITTKIVDATVTWAAAAPNGAPVTAYHVSWRRADGSRPGAVTLPGATLSHVIEEVWSGTDIPFTVTVIAENSAGRGPAASAHKAPPETRPTVTLTRGPRSHQWCAPSPDCAWMHVELTDFPADTEVFLEPHSTDTGYSNVGHTLTTTGEGTGVTDQFAYHGVGETVHVTARLPDGTIVRSKPLYWEAG